MSITYDEYRERTAELYGQHRETISPMSELQRKMLRPDDSWPVWDVWVQGYAATGERGTAWLKGRIGAETFGEACDLLFDGDPYYDRENLSVWGCSCYPNEADARRVFG